MCKHRPLLRDIKRLRNPKEIRMAGKGKTYSWEKGQVVMQDLAFKNVYLCENIKTNIMAVHLLNAIGYQFYYTGNYCFITFQDEDNLVGLAHKDDGNKNDYVEFLLSR